MPDGSRLVTPGETDIDVLSTARDGLVVAEERGATDRAPRELSVKTRELKRSPIEYICMESDWEEFVDAVTSGDPDRVNPAVEEIKSLDVRERIELFEERFDDLRDLYGSSNDGYVRQSIVRVVEHLSPGLGAVVNLYEQGDDALEQVADQTDAVRAFMLEAMTDEDGRVRNSAKRGLRDVFRTYDALEQPAAVEAVMDELDEIAREYSGKRRDHLLEAKEDARFHLQPRFAQLTEGLRDELSE
ncbi:hypothetical protein JCM17823_23840 [Halorubrum gandharaense]